MMTTATFVYTAWAEVPTSAHAVYTNVYLGFSDGSGFSLSSTSRLETRLRHDSQQKLLCIKSL